MARCKFCGTDNLHWLDDNGWHLVDNNNATHQCQPTLKRIEQVHKGYGKGCKHGIALDWFCDECKAEGMYD